MTRIESLLLTACGIFKLIMAFYTKQERYLYSKDFDEEYKKTVERIEKEMERQKMEGSSELV